MKVITPSSYFDVLVEMYNFFDDLSYNSICLILYYLVSKLLKGPGNDGIFEVILTISVQHLT